MRKPLSKVIVICVVALAAYISQAATQAGQEVERTHLANQQGGQDATPQEEINFKLLRMSNGITKNGFTFAGMTYETTTHIKVYVKIVHLDSPEGAKNEYDERLKKAVRIMDQGKVQEQPATKPATTEDRAVEIVPAISKDCKEIFTVLATAGISLRILQSCSLAAIVELEKRGKRGESVDDRFVVR
jgi:hypothetical protein